MKWDKDTFPLWRTFNKMCDLSSLHYRQRFEGLLSEASQRGNVDARYTIGLILYNVSTQKDIARVYDNFKRNEAKKCLEQAYEIFEELAERGHVKSMLMVAQFKAEGMGTPFDKKGATAIIEQVEQIMENQTAVLLKSATKRPLDLMAIQEVTKHMNDIRRHMDDSNRTTYRPARRLAS